MSIEAIDDVVAERLFSRVLNFSRVGEPIDTTKNVIEKERIFSILARTSMVALNVLTKTSEAARETLDTAITDNPMRNDESLSMVATLVSTTDNVRKSDIKVLSEGIDSSTTERVRKSDTALVSVVNETSTTESVRTYAEAFVIDAILVSTTERERTYVATFAKLIELDSTTERF